LTAAIGFGSFGLSPLQPVRAFGIFTAIGVLFGLVPAWSASKIDLTTSLKEGLAASAELPEGGSHGINSFHKLGYGGPCPPSGAHRYYFRVYALDGPLSLPPSTTKGALEKAMNGHVIAKGSLMGTYSRAH
jgi:Raf kinase inhibitor-like YbhB/YbcL family protein